MSVANRKSLFIRVPELSILVLVIVISYSFIAVFPAQDAQYELSRHFILMVMIGSLLVSILIAIISTIGGIGGSLMVTPILLGFTSIDTLIVRATGLVVAMFSGLVSARLLMRKGLADIKLVFFGSVPIILGSIIGAYSAIYFSNKFGEQGDAFVRLALGIIVFTVAYLFIKNGRRSDIPHNEQIGVLAKNIGLYGSFWDNYLKQEIEYKVRRGRYGLLLLLLVGFMGGFFGLGGGWAVVPIFNMLMYVPLKLAAGSSGVLLALGNAAAIWPYISIGALIPLFVAPWMLGQVIGGIIGAHVLTNINASFIRKLLIVLLLGTSIKLIARGIEGVFSINLPLL